MANVGGVFVVLLAGMGLACLIAVFEFIWKSRKLATEDNVRHNQFICKGFSHTNKHLFTATNNPHKKSHCNQDTGNADSPVAPQPPVYYNVVSPSIVNYILDLWTNSINNTVLKKNGILKRNKNGICK